MVGVAGIWRVADSVVLMVPFATGGRVLLGSCTELVRVVGSSDAGILVGSADEVVLGSAAEVPETEPGGTIPLELGVKVGVGTRLSVGVSEGVGRGSEVGGRSVGDADGTVPDEAPVGPGTGSESKEDTSGGRTPVGATEGSADGVGVTEPGAVGPLVGAISETKEERMDGRPKRPVPSGVPSEVGIASVAGVVGVGSVPKAVVIPIKIPVPELGVGWGTVGAFSSAAEDVAGMMIGGRRPVEPTSGLSVG